MKQVIVILLLFLWGCKPQVVPEINEAGVVISGYAENGYIKNTNDYPVRVKQVWRFKGENTLWIKVFQPGEVKKQYMSHQYGFYICDLEGTEIGYIATYKLLKRYNR